jgi:hypothetical protein
MLTNQPCQAAASLRRARGNKLHSKIKFITSRNCPLELDVKSLCLRWVVKESFLRERGDVIDDPRAAKKTPNPTSATSSLHLVWSHFLHLMFSCTTHCEDSKLLATARRYFSKSNCDFSTATAGSRVADVTTQQWQQRCHYILYHDWWGGLIRHWRTEENITWGSPWIRHNDHVYTSSRWCSCRPRVAHSDSTLCAQKIKSWEISRDYFSASRSDNRQTFHVVYPCSAVYVQDGLHLASEILAFQQCKWRTTSIDNARAMTWGWQYIAHLWVDHYHGRLFHNQGLAHFSHYPQ